jgi:creatinine amidohydrolase/Fe(II)-dependent formamide hydrolase-like protein
VTAELGKRIFEMKVDYAVRQIKQLLAVRTATAAPQ